MVGYIKIKAALSQTDLCSLRPCAPARGTLAYVILRSCDALNSRIAAGSAAEGATSLEIQTATFIAAAKSSVVEEVLSNNDRRL